ncbi:hypothetical protein OYE22_13290 [Streptomyces sp. 71268]|nr:hypothetical protein [Streptomyces sp. 71268]WEV26066.1 hypothetical protein OYE22_13290 [Streptomyces sp. 71268]
MCTALVSSQVTGVLVAAGCSPTDGDVPRPEVLGASMAQAQDEHEEAK